MTENEETIIYDTMRSIMDNAVIIAALVRADGSKAAKDAYQNGVYSPCIRLQTLLGTEAMERGRLRHERTAREAEEYFKKKGTKP